MQISVTYYLDVISSWCFWSEPTWAELQRRYSDKVAFDWKIALMDASGLPKSRAQEEWFYRRSGMIMRSPFMLRSDWYEPILPEYLVPNLMALAAKDLGLKDDRVRLALSTAGLRDGAMFAQWDVAAQIAADASGIDRQKLLEHARSTAIEKRARDTTAEWHQLRVTQRPTFVMDSEIGDRAIFSGVVSLAPMTSTLDSFIADLAAYAAHTAHFGAAPAE